VNNLIPLHEAVTHCLIASAQASIHPPNMLFSLVLPTPTIRHLGDAEANRADIHHLCLTIVTRAIEERAIDNFYSGGE